VFSIGLEVPTVSGLHKSDVFLDVCTQRDYLLSGGARVCVNAADVLANLKRLMAFARWEKVPTLSCVEGRRPDEVRGIPNPDCVLGTPGQQKIGFTLLPSRTVVESNNSLAVPLDILEHTQQAILIKRHRDPFTNPKLDRLLTEMPARRFVVFGVPLESSIRLLILGLLLRLRKVTLVADACGYWSPNEAEMALRHLSAKGCEIVTTEQLIQTTINQRRPMVRVRTRHRRSVA